eukprot:scaffold3296_cov112-Cylindrotheca_fusiformis.AAC.2
MTTPDNSRVPCALPMNVGSHLKPSRRLTMPTSRPLIFHRNPNFSNNNLIRSSVMLACTGDVGTWPLEI